MRAAMMPVVDNVENKVINKIAKLLLRFIVKLFSIRLQKSPTTMKHAKRPASHVNPILRRIPKVC